MPRYRDEQWIPTLAEALERRMTVPELRELAGLLPVGPLPTRKAELVAVIRRRLAGDALRAAWERLDELQRAAVAETVHGVESRFDAQRFRAKYGRDPDWGSVDRFGRAGRPSVLRLFFYGRNVIPDDLRERLRGFVPEPAHATLATTADLPEAVPLAVRETERAAQQDLHAVLRLVEAGKLSVSEKTRRPGAAATKLIATALEGGDFYEPATPGGEPAGTIKPFAWALIVQVARLAQPAGGRLSLTRSGAKALGDPASGTLRTAWRRWLDTTLLDELSRVEAIKGQTGRGKRGLTAVAGRRAAIAEALAECPTGRWVATDELFRYMRAAGSDFEITRNPWSLYICDPQYGSLGYDGSHGWNILQARYALCVLFEYAATLGLIDVAYVAPAEARPDFRALWGTDDLAFLSRYDGLTHVRLTSLGAHCLDRSDAYEPAPVEARPALAILPNLELAAIGDGLTHADRLALDRYAEQTSDRVWRLRRDKLLAAVEQGDSVAGVRELLCARGAAPLPAAVARLLDDVADRTGRVTDLGPARLIECADPALAALLATHASTRRLCFPAGDRRVAVPAASERAFRRALRKLGYALAPQGSPTSVASAPRAA